MAKITSITIRALLITLAFFPAEVNAQKRTATSTIVTRKEKNGSITAVTTNRRFTFTSLPGTRGTSDAQVKTLLLLEEFKSERNLSAEGQKSFVTVQAWGGQDANPTKSLWTIKSEGDEGLLVDRFYKVIRRGCCGAEDSFIFFNALTGQKVFTSTRDLFQIEVPNTQLVRLVAYHSMMASIPIPEGKTAKQTIGVIEYGSEKQQLQRVLVRSTAAKVEDTGTPTIKTLYRQKIAGDNPLILWGADKKNDPSSLSDFSIVLSFDEGKDIVIPVRNDRFDLKSATFPRGLTLEASTGFR